MRKPLTALSLALGATIGAVPVANTFAAAPVGSSPTSSISTVSKKNGVSGAAIVQTAFKYLGYPYTATGNSPSTGFSCIGFVSYVYRSNGIPLPGDLGGALAYAPKVAFSSLLPGDILYFQNTVWSGLSHAAIYIGGGRFIHAEYYGRGVVVSSFNKDKVDGDYWIGKYLGANRPWTGSSVGSVIPTTPPSAPSGVPGTHTVNKIQYGPSGQLTMALNVRSGPSKSSGVRAVAASGTTVVILGKQGGWYKVQLPDGTTGWVIASGLSRGSNPNVGNPTSSVPAGAPSTVKRRPGVAVKVSGLRVRVSPSTRAGVVTTTVAGQRMRVLSRRNGWLRVRLSNGRVGWVKAGYTSATQRTNGSRVRTYNARSFNSGSGARGPRLSAGVRVHARAGLKSRVIGLARAGMHLRVLSYRGNWALVRFANGMVGYVRTSYIRR